MATPHSDSYPRPASLDALIREVALYRDRMKFKSSNTHRVWVSDHPLRQALAGGPVGSIERANYLLKYLESLDFDPVDSADTPPIDQLCTCKKPRPENGYTKGCPVHDPAENQHFGDTPFHESDYEPDPEDTTFVESDLTEDLESYEATLAVELHHFVCTMNCNTPTPQDEARARWLVREKGWRPPHAPRTVQLGDGPVVEAEEAAQELSDELKWKLRDPRADKLVVPPEERTHRPSDDAVKAAIETASQVLLETRPDPRANPVLADRPLVPKHSTSHRLLAADIIMRSHLHGRSE